MNPMAGFSYCLPLLTGLGAMQWWKVFHMCVVHGMCVYAVTCPSNLLSDQENYTSLELRLKEEGSHGPK